MTAAERKALRRLYSQIRALHKRLGARSSKMGSSLVLLCIAIEGEATVEQICKRLGMAQPTVCQRIQALSFQGDPRSSTPGRGLVSAPRNGRERGYLYTLTGAGERFVRSLTRA